MVLGRLVIVSDSRAGSRLTPCQWETSLQSNAVSHRLVANRESALDRELHLMTSKPEYISTCWYYTRTLPQIFRGLWLVVNSLSKLDHLWFRQRIVTWPVPSHYLNQCLNIVNWTLGNKLQWNLNRNWNIFHEFKEMPLKMSSGIWWPLCLGLNVLTVNVVNLNL